MDEGAWESLTHLVKRALRVIVKDSLFTEESLHTLCKVQTLTLKLYLNLNFLIYISQRIFHKAD